MFCKNCGAEMSDGQLFCAKCGTKAESQSNACPNCKNPIEPGASFCASCGAPVNEPTKSSPFESNSAPIPAFAGAKIQPRSLVTAIILSIVTCGIYGIYWFVCLTNEMNRLSGRPNDTNGGTAFLFSLITCGIYSYFWAYKMGEKRDVIARENGSSNILYLVLTIFGLGIVVYCLLQDAINKVVDNGQQKY